MGWFTDTAAVTKDRETRERLAEEVAELSGEIKALRRDRDKVRQEIDLGGEVVRLREEIQTLEIERSRRTEEHERQVREVEHQVGLVRRSQQQDVEHAKRMATLEAREGNLSAERDRFERDMTFQREQLTSEINRVDAILQAILTRLPNIDVALDGTLGRAITNGRAKEPADG